MQLFVLWGGGGGEAWWELIPFKCFVWGASCLGFLLIRMQGQTALIRIDHAQPNYKQCKILRFALFIQQILGSRVFWCNIDAFMAYTLTFLAIWLIIGHNMNFWCLKVGVNTGRDS
jgi:hypothetical protein